MRVSLAIVTAGLFLGASPSLRSQETSSPAPNPVALEALSRLEGVDLETNPAVKKAVFKVLETTRGTPHFVQIVKKFKIKDQEPALIDFAAKQPGHEAALEAVRMILSGQNLSLFEKELASPDEARARALVRLLGAASDRQSIPLLLPILHRTAQPLGVRKEAVSALAQSQDGAGELLKLAREEKIPSDLKLSAATALNQVRWPEIKQAAQEVLPLPASNTSEPLPPVSELAKRSGNLANGEKVFFRAESACASCHKVRGQGRDLGPDLSEIGSKLGKDALYESILDPSSGISFGYEATQIALKSGDEAYGLVISETADTVSLKDLNGLVSHHKRSDIESLEKLKLSIMPAGLQQTMTVQEFVDLIEYLHSLKKAK